MNQIKELFTKAKAWVNKTYDNKSPMNKFDWILIGIATGCVLTAIKSVILSIAVVAILAHHAYKRG
ncbi:hypothetical protein ENTB43_116 [Enterobacter phage Entb_43]|nr:hypothetical protein ENTB43_116 [Enterobacter phage Entb_43]